MNQIPIKLGPLALLMMVVSICLTMLSVLTFTTARADVRLTEKYAETVSIRYELEQSGQEFLARLDSGEGDLFSGVETDSAGVRWKTFEKDGFLLNIGFTVDQDGYDVVAWRQEKHWNEDTSVHVWQGE